MSLYFIFELEIRIKGFKFFLIYFQNPLGAQGIAMVCQMMMCVSVWWVDLGAIMWYVCRKSGNIRILDIGRESMSE